MSTELVTHNEFDVLKDKVADQGKDIALIKQSLEFTANAIKELHDLIKDQNSDTKREVNLKFGPVKLVVYGAIALILNVLGIALVQNLLNNINK